MTRVIVTPRLVLRPARADDLAALHAVFAHPAAMRYWSHPEHDCIERTRDTLQALIDTPTERVVTRDGSVIGKAGAWREWEVGFILHPDHWGQGLATEAMAAVVANLMAMPRVPFLTAEADPRNAGSVAVLRKLGFAQTHAASRTMQWRNEWCDSLYFRLDRAASAGRPVKA